MWVIQGPIGVTGLRGQGLGLILDVLQNPKYPLHFPINPQPETLWYYSMLPNLVVRERSQRTSRGPGHGCQGMGYFGDNAKQNGNYRDYIGFI